MKKEMYSIYDRKAQLYGSPFYASNQQTAVRSFTRAVNDPTLDLCMFPQDYTLYELGRFDDESCEFEITNPPRVICSAEAVKAKQEN